MATVKDFSEFQINTDTQCYAFLSPTQNISIYSKQPNGDIEITDFEAFSVSGGTLIVFDNYFDHQFKYCYTAVLDNGIEQTFQGHTLESINTEMFDIGREKPHKFFALFDSVDINVNPAEVIKNKDRCDIGVYAPRGFLLNDGIKETSYDPEVFKAANYKNFQPILSLNGVLHIFVQEIWPINMTWRNWPIVTGVSKTLSGAFKLMSEWAYLYDNGMSEEKIAHNSSAFIKEIGITPEMISELNEIQVDMPVFRFINGYGDARHGFSEVNQLPESINNLIKSQVMYMSLASLSKHHPEHPVFDEELKKTELEETMKNIYSYSLIAFPTIDPSDVSFEDLFESLYGEDNKIPKEFRIDGHGEVMQKAILSAKKYWGAM